MFSYDESDKPSLFGDIVSPLKVNELACKPKMNQTLEGFGANFKKGELESKNILN